ncbi:hypothetical protein EVJ58_g10171 [Rhodofomes roseus]|uniref:F-box domain-containing protein n=1 Tax=Rhodofomes roseus TaxID=34475 RepID=A0A4Y9XPC5_9APHY|nr:hypothetical protein EVJ58_g10171 [Rhodofomes roseus]
MASKVDELPTELIVHVFAELNCADLLRCREVCRLFDAVCKESAVLQYKAELAKAGLEDHPTPRPLSAAERTQLLRKHQAAWSSLDISYEEVVPMLVGQTWELYGGVLAQGPDQSSLRFRQLPSALRGIEDKEWTIEDLGFEIRDFAMDPAQELLVAIQMPDSPTSVFHVHLRNIYTAAPHTAAPNPAVLTHQPDGMQVSYSIQISGDHLGVFVMSANEISNEVVIWNWKTGVCKLAELQALRTAEEPQLLVADFLAGTGELVKMDEAEFLCAFHYPSMVAQAVPLGITIRSDPAPGWTPHPDSPVPFFTAREDRLLVITFTVYSVLEGHMQSLLFVRTSTLLSYVDALKGETKRRFSWDEWGPNQTRMMRAPRHHSSVWVCYVFGMRFVTARKRRGKPKYIEVYDFSRFARHRRAAPEPGQGEEEEEDIFGLEDHWMSDETEMPEGIFDDKVATSLPYHMRTMIPPRGDGEKDFQCVMLSEDTIIIMCNDDSHHRNIRLLTF